MRRKSDYSCIVFFDGLPPKKWRHVHKLNGFAQFLNKSHAGWKYLNVYRKRSGQFLKRFYKGNFIPPFLPLLLFALSIQTLSTFDKTLESGVATFIYGFNNTATISTQLDQKGGML